MATKIVIQNAAVEKADAARDVRKLRSILGDLRDGYQNWDTLTAAGRKTFIQAFEARMDSEVTHPIFRYRISYRRVLEVQLRLLGRVLQGEIETYPAFVTR